MGAPLPEPRRGFRRAPGCGVSRRASVRLRWRSGSCGPAPSAGRRQVRSLSPYRQYDCHVLSGMATPSSTQRLPLIVCHTHERGAAPAQCARLAGATRQDESTTDAANETPSCAAAVCRVCWWLCERQTSGGGLNGRPEKLQDVCYSWWCMSALAVCERMHWINGDKLRRFILRCQDEERGGISDR